MEIYSVSKELAEYQCVDMPVNNNTYEVYLATIQDNNIGYIIISQNENKFTIEHFYVRNGYRNLGIGQRLLTRCLEDYHTISLMVDKTNGRAIHIYRKYGFNVSSTRSKYVTMKILPKKLTK